ncbi:Lcl domain-containing protein [Dysgonomonas termitidis]|uniref:DUF1566 domain-containing protein n=1 Tax=Dysgonomonas termitidis TaxID=1516126 RepID=A0ABV9KZ48_9BACT
MNVSRLLIVSVALILGCSALSGQETGFLQQGRDCYRQGDYECAIKNYKKSQALENQKVDDLLGNAESCRALLKKGDDYFFQSDYAKAKTYYQLILETNPEDGNAKNRITACDKNLKQSEAPYVELKGVNIIVAKKDASNESLVWADANTLCENLILGGYTDWRLPTKNELSTIFTNKDIIGSFHNMYYWSGTKWSSTRHSAVDLAGGKVLEAYDTQTMYCRCVPSTIPPRVYPRATGLTIYKN